MAQEDLARLKIDKSGMAYGRRRAKMPLLWVVAALIILASAAAYKYVLYPAVEVEVTAVSRFYPYQAYTLLNASGYVVAQRKAAVSSKATGRLEWLGVEEGSRVKAGEVIARLEDRDVVASRDQAAANLANLRSALEQAKAELADASANFDRSKELFAGGFIARMDYDTAETRYKKAVAGVAGGESAIASAEAALRSADVAVEYTRIRAPFDAVVLTKDADVGDIITPFGAAMNSKASVVTIADMASLDVEADVSEANLENVKVGQPCEVQLDAIPEKRFRSAVHMIVPTADRTKASVTVKVRFIEKDPRILPEMSATVAFLSRTISPADEQPRTGVNSASVATREGRPVVFLVRGDRVEETPVRTGAKFGNMLEVLEGVKPGDKVVLSPAPGLKNGDKVTVKEG